MAGTDRNKNAVYAAAHFALELDHKQDVGLFRSVEGGGIRADVMTYQNGGNYDRWRQLGKPKFEDIKVQVGMAMSQPFFDWIAEFFEGKGTRKDGAIVAADFYYVERARREFTNALIKELTFPKLDATDKNAAYLSVAFAVEGIEYKKGSGNKLGAPLGFDKQKLWTANNFSLSIDKYPDACRRCAKIDSFTVKQNIIEYHAGGMRAPIKTPSQIDYPNLVFYIPEADAEQLEAHCNDRVVKGTVRPAAEMNGHIRTYDNEGSPLFDVEFHRADILSVTPDKQDSSSEEIKLVKVEMYTESMTFSFPKMEVV